MTIFFRSASVEDIPLLRRLADRIWRTAYVEMISVSQIDYMLAWMYSPEKIAAELAAGVLWEIAQLDTEPVGYLALGFAEGGPAELHKLYLLPEYHGRGFGQAMLTRATELTHTHGSPELRLRVNKSNSRALRSYERAGFQIVDLLIADIGGGFVMDDYVLAKAIARQNDQ